MNRHAVTTRAALLGLLAFLIFGALACRYGYLMTHRHEELLSKAKNTYTSARMLPGCRGRIYDGAATPNLLVMSKVSYRVIATPRHMQRKGVDLRDEIMNQIIDICKIDAAQLKARFASGKIEIIAADKLDLDAAEQLRALNLRGLRFEKIEIRSYPKGQCAANALGFLDNTEQGVQGVEKTYDKELQPVDGKVIFEHGAKNQKLDQLKVIPPANGKDIYLTIQEPIQAIVEEELKTVV
jgi:stage V sporulation protein D (sporulation-specific penicillin-binding protein)